MKTSLKRMAAPRTWPILRKVTKFVTRPRPKGQTLMFTLPMAVVLRDILKVASSSLQAKRLMREHEVRINGRRVFQPDDSVGLMDVLSIGKETFLITITKKGILTVEPSDGTMVQKLVGKTHVRGGRTQLNFLSGMNILVDKDPYKTGDSLVIEKGKPGKHLPFTKGANVLVMGGYHMGARGTIEKIENTTCTVKSGKDIFQTTKDNVYVMA